MGVGGAGEVGLEGSLDDIRLNAFFTLRPISLPRPSSESLGGGLVYLEHR